MELIYVINSVDESATRGGVEGRGRGPALKVNSWRTRLGPGAAGGPVPAGDGSENQRMRRSAGGRGGPVCADPRRAGGCAATAGGSRTGGTSSST